MHDVLPNNLSAWPGTLEAESDPEDYIYPAMYSVMGAWIWESAEQFEKCLASFNKDQLSLWTIFNVDGQIRNGGFTQLLYNSYGELAGLAVDAYRHFGMDEQAAVVEQALSKLGKPVPISRAERWAMLRELSGVNFADRQPGDMEPLSDLHRAIGPIFDELEGRYYRLDETFGNFPRRLAEEISIRKARFFDLTLPPPPKLPRRAVTIRQPRRANGANSQTRRINQKADRKRQNRQALKTLAIRLGVSFILVWILHYFHM